MNNFGLGPLLLTYISKSCKINIGSQYYIAVPAVIKMISNNTITAKIQFFNKNKIAIKSEVFIDLITYLGYLAPPQELRSSIPAGVSPYNLAYLDSIIS